METQKISKFLSLILRHAPETIDLVLDNNGWADVDELITKGNKKIKLDFEILENIVLTNDKKRFAFNADLTKIRANQGHSIEVELNLEARQPPDILYHGTVDKYISLIKSEGLKKMSRQHVHLSKDIETAVKVGSRRGKAIILEVKAGDMHNDGIAFYCSENGVWLTDRVIEQYIVFPS